MTEFNKPQICEYCSQEVKPGMLNAVLHKEKCPCDAPSSSIESWKWHVEGEAMKSINRYKNAVFNKFVYSKMKDMEQVKWMFKTMPQYVGSDAMDEINNFRKEMIEKYAPENEMLKRYFGL